MIQRSIMDVMYDPDPSVASLKKIGGRSIIIEVDEALVGKKHGHLSHGNNNKTMKIWVVGFAERSANNKEIRYTVVKNRSM